MTLDQIEQYLRSVDPNVHLDIIMESTISYTKDAIESIISGANLNRGTKRGDVNVNLARLPMLSLGHGWGRNSDRIDIYICFYEDKSHYYSMIGSYLDRTPSSLNNCTLYWSNSVEYFMSSTTLSSGITKMIRESKLSELVQ